MSRDLVGHELVVAGAPERGAAVQLAPGPGEPLLAVELSPAGGVLAAGGSSRAISLWAAAGDAQEAQEGAQQAQEGAQAAPWRNTTDLPAHRSAVTSLQFLSDTELVAASADSTLSLWDLETCTKLRKLAGHRLAVNQVAADAPSDPNLFASASDDGAVLCWDKRQRGFVHSFHSDFPLLTVALRNSLVYASGINPVISSHDLRSTSTKTLTTLHNDSVTSLAIDDNVLVSASFDNTLRTFDSLLQAQIASVTANLYNQDLVPMRATICKNRIFSADSLANTVNIHSATSTKLLASFTPGHARLITDIDCKHNSLVTCSLDGTVIVTNV